MTEVNYHKINVDELMNEIREEVALRQNSALLVSSISHVIPLKSLEKNEHIESLVNNAEFITSVRTNWPEKYSRFPLKLSKKLQRLALKVLEIIFRDQRGFNFSLVQALRELLLLNRQLIEQIATLQAQISATGAHLQAMDERVSATGAHLQAMDERVSATGAHLQVMDERVSATDTRLQVMDERVSATDTRLQVMDERHIKDDSYLKNDLAQQKRLITLFLEEARQRLPEHFNQDQLQTFVNEEQHLLDAFYVAFEDQFRGSRKDIIDRLKVYLPLIAEAKVGQQNSPILDVGCGRGEWLELLHKTGYTAQGLDINRIMIDQCRTRGFQVIEGDVISYLQFLPDASLGAVTGFHIIEHLPFEVLIKLFDETVRVLKPGGIAIFETPNPQNVLVGSKTFYLDPTHRNPLPSPLIKFIVEARGLHQVKILELHPYPADLRVSGSDIAERFNDYFYGPQDYALIGHKI